MPLCSTHFDLSAVMSVYVFYAFHLPAIKNCVYVLGYQSVLMGQDQEVVVHGSNSSLGSDFILTLFSLLILG